MVVKKRNEFKILISKKYELFVYKECNNLNGFLEYLKIYYIILYFLLILFFINLHNLIIFKKYYLKIILISFLKKYILIFL